MNSGSAGAVVPQVPAQPMPKQAPPAQTRSDEKVPTPASKAADECVGFDLGICADGSCVDGIRYRRQVTVRFPPQIEASVALVPGCVIALAWFKDPELWASCKYVTEPKDRALRLTQCGGDMRLGEENTVTSSTFGIGTDNCPVDLAIKVPLVDVNCGGKAPPKMHHFREFKRAHTYGLSPKSPGANGQPFLVRAQVRFWEGTTEDEYAEVLRMAARAGGRPFEGANLGVGGNDVHFEFPPTITDEGYDRIYRALWAHPAVSGVLGDVKFTRLGW
ncbi:MAG: hypothetical protein SFV15_15030 [Polyangiaceae bacterium]|nr:hypothetical protein [Polyangiaceae bacterium]